MSNDWKRFGDRNQFAFEFRFQKDPDNGRSATPLESNSWGEFRFWVRGFNLCQHQHHNHTHQEVSWHLSPLLTWFADNWDPIFHEERFPLACDRPNARLGYLDSLRRYLADTDPVMEKKGMMWFDWWQRHALRSCRQGGLFPDLFFRRMVDFIEISWGEFPLEGVAKDFYFNAPERSQNLPIQLVADPLMKGLLEAVSSLNDLMPHDSDLKTLSNKVRQLSDDGRSQIRLAWYAPKLSDLQDSLRSKIRNINQFAQRAGYIHRLSPAVAMFGSLSPEIGDSDLETLISCYIDAHGESGDSAQMKPLISLDPELPVRNPYDIGYDDALNLLDQLGDVIPTAEWIDIHAICDHLDIRIREEPLHDSNIRGVAIAGPSVMPTILLNSAHPNNRQDEGKRFSLGHELCHILHDRFFGSGIYHASGCWAPSCIEKRANAFSAMLLMPVDILNQKISALDEPLDSQEGIATLSTQLKVSRKSLIWHLYNLNKLDEFQRTKLEL
ncbi:MAG: ImmA/IrrE family metallo-endopeptidase [Magnetococcales bacterium]|nr:ImmA/IrrE family metallo-endopeptidase [Magnetococcales bacterium]